MQGSCQARCQNKWQSDQNIFAWKIAEANKSYNFCTNIKNSYPLVAKLSELVKISRLT